MQGVFLIEKIVFQNKKFNIFFYVRFAENSLSLSKNFTIRLFRILIFSQPNVFKWYYVYSYNFKWIKQYIAQIAEKNKKPGKKTKIGPKSCWNKFLWYYTFSVQLDPIVKWDITSNIDSELAMTGNVKKEYHFQIFSLSLSF